MACDVWQLTKFCDGSLQGKRLEKLLDHLEECEECSSVALQLLARLIGNQKRIRDALHLADLEDK